jgi:hypothetical protein
MAAAAQTFTIQLNSSTAERTSENEERYQISLTPAVEVPYLAQPRAQLESLAFSNSFTNVSAHLDNNKIAFQLAYAKTTPDANGNYVLDASLSDKRYELTIPDGHYDAAGLEEELARQAYLTHKASDKVVASHAAYEPPSAITPDSSLWADLNVLVTRRPFVNAPKPPGTTGGTTDSDTSSWRLAANVAAGATSIEIVAQYSSATGQPAGFHLIGATITSAITDSGGVAGMFAADTIVMRNHANQARHDSTSSPLYRLIASTGGIDGWNIHTIRTLEYDAVRLPDALLACEGETMDQLREAGYVLVNHNRPICANEAQRARMKRWRDEHPGYMAAKGREHRQRRRVLREQETAAAVVTQQA